MNPDPALFRGLHPIFHAICKDAEDRFNGLKLRTPWHHASHVYASDGRLLVRTATCYLPMATTAAIIEHQQGTKRPKDPDLYFQDLQVLKTPVVLPDVAGEEECPACNGCGRDIDEHRFPCASSDGTGRVPILVPTVVFDGDYHVAPWMVALLRTFDAQVHLPVKERRPYRDHQGKVVNDKKAWFAFDCPDHV